MKKLILLFLVIIPALAFAQSDSLKKENKNSVNSIGVEEAQFKGGRKAMVDFINKTLVYPADAVKNKIECQVKVVFEINENGKIINTRTRGCMFESLNKEALRVIMAMPDWIPEKNNGKAVQSTVALPLNFKL